MLYLVLQTRVGRRRLVQERCDAVLLLDIRDSLYLPERTLQVLAPQPFEGTHHVMKGSMDCTSLVRLEEGLGTHSRNLPLKERCSGRPGDGVDANGLTLEPNGSV